MRPALVVCAHGTDDPDGRATVVEIADAVAARLPGVGVRAAYVDVQEPSLDVVVDELVARGERVVVVPVLLTLGFHTEVDVAAAVDRHPGVVVSTGALGPDEALADALVDRLAETGAPRGCPVVVAVAGSSRSEAADRAHEVGRAVGRRWDGPVTVGFLAAAKPTVAEAVAAARAGVGGTESASVAGSSGDAAPGSVGAPGPRLASSSQGGHDRVGGTGAGQAASGDGGAAAPPVAVASYLIGRGFFQRRVEAAGGDLTSEPLGAHPRLVDVVVARYLSGSATLGA